MGGQSGRQEANRDDEAWAVAEALHRLRAALRQSKARVTDLETRDAQHSYARTILAAEHNWMAQLLMRDGVLSQMDGRLYLLRAPQNGMQGINSTDAIHQLPVPDNIRGVRTEAVMGRPAREIQL